MFDAGTSPVKRAGVPVAPPKAGSATTLIVIAVILAAVVGSLPFGSLALYPFSLFVTLIHETGHAVAAVLTGGSVNSLTLASNLSGVTWTSGGIEALIAPAGYLGATLVGVALLLLPVRWSRAVLGTLALIPLAALLLFNAGNVFTTLWCVGFFVVLVLAAWRLSPRITAFLQIFLGVEAGLNAFRDLLTLLLISGSGAHMQTDATNMSHALFLPPIVWAVSWTVISLLLLIAALAAVIRRDIRQLR